MGGVMKGTGYTTQRGARTQGMSSTVGRNTRANAVSQPVGLKWSEVGGDLESLRWDAADLLSSCV